MLTVFEYILTAFVSFGVTNTVSKLFITYKFNKTMPPYMHEKLELSYRFKILGLLLSSLKNMFIRLNAEVHETNFTGFKEHHCSF